MFNDSQERGLIIMKVIKISVLKYSLAMENMIRGYSYKTFQVCTMLSMALLSQLHCWISVYLSQSSHNWVKLIKRGLNNSDEQHCQDSVKQKKFLWSL